MTASLPRMIVADLDGTLLHDADTFEGTVHHPPFHRCDPPVA